MGIQEVKNHFMLLNDFDDSDECKSKKTSKGKFLVTTRIYCKNSDKGYEKIVTYQKLEWHELIKAEFFDTTFMGGK